MKEDNEKAHGDDEWESRRLCSDPACIGVVGADGRCKECGRPYPGDLSGDGPGQEPPAEQDTPLPEENDASPEENGDPAGGADAPEEFADSEEPGSDDEWERRRLCGDPACIGVIGADGRCKECGRPYEEK